MAKTIIFCADGTWNGPGEDGDHHWSNVRKLFLNLDGTKPAEPPPVEEERSLNDARRELVQIAKYLHGVGDTSNSFVRRLEGATGAGLSSRVIRGYTFVSRNYQPGDRVVLVGFSRGAYTVRALAGLIAAQGVIDATRVDLERQRDAAYDLGASVWYAHRKRALDGDQSLREKFDSILSSLPGLLYRDASSVPRREATIEAVGVWDTVGALGIPKFDLDLERIDTFQFADTKLSPKVRAAYHAVSVDERRADFTPTLWDPDPRVCQVLFPGAHSDVGGGYPRKNLESGLSDGALRWMMRRLTEHGVTFDGQPPSAVVPAPSSSGPAHRPWDGNPLLEATRDFPSGLRIARSVVDRLNVPAPGVASHPAAAPEVYDPRSLDGYLVGRSPRPDVVIEEIS